MHFFLFPAQVGQMTQMYDTSKIHDNAVECRRLWKSMVETQNYGYVLNRRQKLFDIKVTNDSPNMQ